MKRTLSIVLVAGAASLLSPAPSPSSAQGVGAGNQEEAVSARLKLIGQLEDGLRFAEAARLRGECSTVEYASSRFYGYHMTILPPELVEDFQRRMREIADRPCPPLAATPSAAPPSSAPPPKPVNVGPRSPDAAPTPPVADTPTLPQKTIDDVEKRIRDAEAARLRGDCERMLYLLNTAKAIRYFFAGAARAAIEAHYVAWDRQIEDIRSRPCPPQSGAVVPQPAEAPGATPEANGSAPAGTPVPQDTPDGHESILDEIGDDTGATQTGLPVQPPADPPRTAPPPPPPRPKEVHVPPKPVEPAESPGSATGSTPEQPPATSVIDKPYVPQKGGIAFPLPYPTPPGPPEIPPLLDPGALIYGPAGNETQERRPAPKSGDSRVQQQRNDSAPMLGPLKILDGAEVPKAERSRQAVEAPEAPAESTANSAPSLEQASDAPPPPRPQSNRRRDRCDKPEGERPPDCPKR